MAIAFGDGKVYESHFDVLTDNWIGKDADVEAEGPSAPSPSPGDKFLEEFRKLKQQSPQPDEPSGTIVPPITTPDEAPSDEMSGQKRRLFQQGKRIIPPVDAEDEMPEGSGFGPMYQKLDTHKDKLKNGQTLRLKDKNGGEFYFRRNEDLEDGWDFMPKPEDQFEEPTFVPPTDVDEMSASKRKPDMMSPTPMDQQVPEDLEVQEAPLSAEADPFPQDVRRSDEKPSGAIDKLLGLKGERYQTWPEKLARSIISAVALPGDVLKGEEGERSFQRAIDLAGLAVLGPAPIAKKVADGTLGSFVGVSAKADNLSKDLLNRATTLETKGADPDAIFKSTGWFRGLEGEWRREISDLNADWKLPVKEVKDVVHDDGWTMVGSQAYKELQFVKDKTYKLSEVFEHERLFTAYPELKDLPIKFDSKMDLGTGGYFQWLDNSHGIIVMNGNRADPETLRGVVLHELQHFIQHKEGFLTGTNPQHAFYAAGIGLRDRIKGRVKELEATLGRKPNPKEVNEDPVIKELGDLWNQMRMTQEEFGLYLYKRMPGEIEARHTQYRRNWGSLDRIRETPRQYQERIKKEIGEVDPLPPTIANQIEETPAAF